jgi:hypothetical protein
MSFGWLRAQGILLDVERAVVSSGGRGSPSPTRAVSRVGTLDGT